MSRWVFNAVLAFAKNTGLDSQGNLSEQIHKECPMHYFRSTLGRLLLGLRSQTKRLFSASKYCSITFI